MSIAKLAEHIGKRGILQGKNPAFSIRVKVIDVRKRWGRTDYKVEPKSGAGSTWVEAYRVTLDSEGEE